MEKIYLGMQRDREDRQNLEELECHKGRVRREVEMRREKKAKYILERRKKRTFHVSN